MVLIPLSYHKLIAQVGAVVPSYSSTADHSANLINLPRPCHLVYLVRRAHRNRLVTVHQVPPNP
jgi:hypothetical protein